MTEPKATKVVPHDRGIANLSSLGILLVVLGHSSPETLAAPGSSAQAVFRGLIEVIYLFHMPLFFFISGNLLAYTNPPGRPLDFGRFVLGKARRLLLPYWILSSLAFPLKALMKGQAIRPVDLSPLDYLRSLLVPWQNSIIFFWFLPTLFLLFLLAPVFLRVLRARSLAFETVVTLALASASILIIPVFWHDPLNYRGALAHAILFWLGMLWRARGPDLSTTGHTTMGGVAGLVFLGLWLILYARWIPESTPSHAAARLGLACSGVAMCLGLVQAATRLGLAKVPWIDGWSYQIYLLSWFPQMLVKLVVYRMLGAGYWPSTLLMLIGGLAIPIAVARLVQRRFPRLRPMIGL